MTKQESGVGGAALQEPHVRRAIEHLRRLGDTDVLPALPEYIFFREAMAELPAGGTNEPVYNQTATEAVAKSTAKISKLAFFDATALQRSEDGRPR